MKTMNVLASAEALSDQELLARLDHLAGRERETVAELVAHLAALDERPSLRLSEDVTCGRIDVARACRKFPEILHRGSSADVAPGEGGEGQVRSRGEAATGGSEGYRFRNG